jgi:hypothetical protein
MKSQRQQQGMSPQQVAGMLPAAAAARSRQSASQGGAAAESGLCRAAADDDRGVDSWRMSSGIRNEGRALSLPDVLMLDG